MTRKEKKEQDKKYEAASGIFLLLIFYAMYDMVKWFFTGPKEEVRKTLKGMTIIAIVILVVYYFYCLYVGQSFSVLRLLGYRENYYSSIY